MIWLNAILIYGCLANRHKFYDSKTQEEYDYSDLTNDFGYEYERGSLKIRFNIGNVIPESKIKDATAIVTDTNSQNRVFGYEHKKKIWLHKEKNETIFALTYYGDSCETDSSSLKKINFFMICDKNQGTFSIKEVKDCEISLVINSPSGCPVYRPFYLQIFKGFIGLILVTFYIVANGRHEWCGRADEEEKPLVREMKNVIRVGKRIIFKRGTDNYTQV